MISKMDSLAKSEKRRLWLSVYASSFSKWFGTNYPNGTFVDSASAALEAGKEADMAVETASREISCRPRKFT